MPINVSVFGNDLSVQKLIVDILEISLNNVKIDKFTNSERLYDSLNKNKGSFYNLIILDCGKERKSIEEIISEIKKNYSYLIERIIIIIDAKEKDLDSSIFNGISSIAKPFSLDDFGELVKKLCTA